MSKKLAVASLGALGVLSVGYLRNQASLRFDFRTRPSRLVSDGFVSVVIPTYNEENYIGNALTSVMNQTYGNMEVIVVDYMSVDRTAEISRSLGARVVQTRRMGIAYARNLGASLSSGKWVLHFDADTVLENRALEKLVNKAKKGYLCVHAFAGLYDGSPLVKALWGWYMMLKPKWMTARINMVEREAFFSIGGFNEELDKKLLEGKPPLEDKDFGRRFWRRYPNKIIYLPQVKAGTSVRRMRRMGLFSRGTWKAFRDGAYAYAEAQGRVEGEAS